jgi:hypothetical protein
MTSLSAGAIGVPVGGQPESALAVPITTIAQSTERRGPPMRGRVTLQNVRTRRISLIMGRRATFKAVH